MARATLFIFSNDQMELNETLHFNKSRTKRKKRSYENVKYERMPQHTHDTQHTIINAITVHLIHMHQVSQTVKTVKQS